MTNLIQNVRVQHVVSSETSEVGFFRMQLKVMMHTINETVRLDQNSSQWTVPIDGSRLNLYPYKYVCAVNRFEAPW